MSYHQDPDDEEDESDYDLNQEFDFVWENDEPVPLYPKEHDE